MGWDVQVRRDESKEEQFKEKIGGAAHTLGEQLGISDELAERLTLAGGFNPEMVVDMPADYIASALEIDLEQGEAILARAQEIASIGADETAEPAEPTASPETTTAPVESEDIEAEVAKD